MFSLAYGRRGLRFLRELLLVVPASCDLSEMSLEHRDLEKPGGPVRVRS